MSNLQGCINQHNFAFRDTVDAKAPFENVATVHVQQLLVPFFLEHGRVIAARLADDADEVVIRQRRRRHVKRDRVGIKLAVVRANHHLSHPGVCDQRGRNSSEELLRTDEASRQLATINRDAHRGREFITRDFETEIRRSRIDSRRAERRNRHWWNRRRAGSWHIKHLYRGGWWLVISKDVSIRFRDRGRRATENNRPVDRRVIGRRFPFVNDSVWCRCRFGCGRVCRGLLRTPAKENITEHGNRNHKESAGRDYLLSLVRIVWIKKLHSSSRLFTAQPASHCRLG